MTWVNGTSDEYGSDKRTECPVCGARLEFVEEGSWYAGITDEYRCPKCGVEVTHRFYLEYTNTEWRGDVEDSVIVEAEENEAAQEKPHFQDIGNGVYVTEDDDGNTVHALFLEASDLRMVRYKKEEKEMLVFTNGLPTGHEDVSPETFWEIARSDSPQGYYDAFLRSRGMA